MPPLTNALLVVDPIVTPLLSHEYAATDYAG
jgi:hypothetical protein